MPHKIPLASIERHTKSISDTKRTQVSNLQNHIQEILGDTHYTFLQGSYKNDTSISDIQDVDIVAVRKTTFSSVHTGLSFPISIPWTDIFSEIETKLKQQRLYTWTVMRRDKCIEVSTSTFKADVVPAVQINADVQFDPIAIYSFRTMTEKKNSPRTHYKNGIAKHDATSQRYKPMVRMFKNLVANHFVTDAPVSSHQIESLVYSSPNDNFLDDQALSFLVISAHILDSLQKNTPIPSVCGGEMVTATWDASKRSLFVSTLQSSFQSAYKGYKADTIEDARQHWDTAFNV